MHDGLAAGWNEQNDYRLPDCQIVLSRSVGGTTITQACGKYRRWLTRFYDWDREAKAIIYTTDRGGIRHNQKRFSVQTHVL
jgi:hypothetical protein